MAKNDLYSQINMVLAKEGINTMTGTMYDFIAIWKQWYRGNVNDFHNYNLKMANGTTTKCEKLTLGMAKKICEDFSKLQWTENVEIKLDTDKKTKRLWDILNSKRNNFVVNFPEVIEKMFALGTAMLVEYKDHNDVLIDYIEADLIIPFKYNNSYVSGVITLSRFNETKDDNKEYYTHLTVHKFEKGRYIKDNYLYKSDNINSLGDKIFFGSKFPDVLPHIEYETDIPHFQILRPNISNNLDFDSPMGISVFSNHIDKLKAIDEKYDSANNEFITGRKRILVDRTALKGSIKVNEATGEIDNVLYFDTSDRTYVAIGGMKEQPVKEIDFKLRTKEHIDAINADLNYLSAGVGLGQDFYQFNSNAVKTATEVISDNSDTFRSKENHQIIIRQALEDMIASICYLDGIKSKFIQITFDDSIIEDKNADARQALVEYNAGLIDQVEYFMQARGITEEEAQMLVDKICERQSCEDDEEELDMFETPLE